jgi:uncharacterized protein YhaN
MQNYLNQQKQKQKQKQNKKDKIENIELICWTLAAIFFVASFLNVNLIFTKEFFKLFSLKIFILTSILTLVFSTIAAIFYNKSL